MGKSRPDRYKKHMKRSDRFVEQKRFKKAIHELRQGFRLLPYSPLAWAQLAISALPRNGLQKQFRLTRWQSRSG